MNIAKNEPDVLKYTRWEGDKIGKVDTYHCIRYSATLARE